MRDFFRFHLFRRSSSKYIYYAMMLLAAITGLIFLFNNNLVYAIFFFFASIMLIVVRVIGINSTISKIAKNTKLNYYKYTLEFSSDNVEYVVRDTVKNYNYSDFLGIYETKYYIYYYINKNGALILNKNLLTVDELNQVRIYSKTSKKYHRVLFK